MREARLVGALLVGALVVSCSDAGRVKVAGSSTSSAAVSVATTSPEPSVGSTTEASDMPSSSWTAAPTTTAVMSDWRARLEEAARSTKVVIADDPAALAVRVTGDDWLLVNATTGAEVMARGLGTVIGAGAVGGGFVVVTNAGDSRTGVNVEAVSRDGSVHRLGGFEIPLSMGLAPPIRARVVTHGSSYVLVETQTNTGHSIGTLAVVSGRTVSKADAGTIYGTLNVTDSGALTIAGGVTGSSLAISIDAGASWTTAFFGTPAFDAPIVMPIGNDRVLATEGLDPNQLVVVRRDGTIASRFQAHGEHFGWLPIGSTDTQVVLLGRGSGQTITLDLAAGTTSGSTALFDTRGGFIMTAWTTPTGAQQALIANGSDCQPDGRNVFGDCPSMQIINASG